MAWQGAAGAWAGLHTQESSRPYLPCDPSFPPWEQSHVGWMTLPHPSPHPSPGAWQSLLCFPGVAPAGKRGCQGFPTRLAMGHGGSALWKGSWTGPSSQASWAGIFPVAASSAGTVDKPGSKTRYRSTPLAGWVVARDSPLSPSAKARWGDRESSQRGVGGADSSSSILRPS